MFQIANLLLHSEDVPPQARAALASAMQAPIEQRGANLCEAAIILHYEAGLDCDEARELVGLESCHRCADDSEEG